MPRIASVSVTAGRKIVERYCTRETAVVVNLELTPEDQTDDERIIRETIRGLQDLVDEELGDAHSANSFRHNRPAEDDDPFANE